MAEEESPESQTTGTPEGVTENRSGAPGGLAILLLSLAMEGVLGGAGYFWIAQQGRDVAQTIGFSPAGTVAGIAGAAVAVALVGLGHDLVTPRIDWLHGWREWVERQLLPFLAPLGTREMLGVALSAGLGEELFFRGALQPVVGLLPTAILFGLAHIGGLLRRETLPYFLYTLFWGLVFGLAYDLIRALWPLIVMHAGFDFAILLYLRSSWRPTRDSS